MELWFGITIMECCDSEQLKQNELTTAAGHFIKLEEYRKDQISLVKSTFLSQVVKEHQDES